MNSLDLYAKVEPFIGFYEEYEKLYDKYLELIEPLGVKKCLDIGWNNGKFLRLLQDKGYEAFGIDRSLEMLKRAIKLGVEAKNLELNELKEDNFDCAFAIGDVLNYMNKDELKIFFQDLKRVLKRVDIF